MVTYSDTTIRDTYSPTTGAVNSGTAIYLNCTGVTLSQEAFTNAAPTPGKSPLSSTHSQMLHEGDFLGVGVPIITLSGVIDVLSTASNTVTLKLLQQMLKSGHIFEFVDKYDTVAPTYRISSLSGTFPSETITYIRCMVTAMTANTSPVDSKEGQILVYTLSLIEVP